jgi:uncharacterized protein (DUF2141 family)
MLTTFSACRATAWPRMTAPLARQSMQIPPASPPSDSENGLPGTTEQLEITIPSSTPSSLDALSEANSLSQVSTLVNAPSEAGFALEPSLRPDRTLPAPENTEFVSAVMAPSALIPNTESLLPANPTDTLEATAQPGSRVRLVIHGVRPGQGLVNIAIFMDEKSFPHPSGASQTLSLDADRQTLEAEVIVSGRCAIGVFQDLNGDGALSRNRYGIPIEPFAFSNNAKGKRGPPAFSDAAILVGDSQDGQSLVLQISLP